MDKGRHWFARLSLSFLDKTNAIVTSFAAATLLLTRSAGVAYFLVGAVTCTLTVKLVKKAIRQPRPPPALQRKLKASFGMPSTHSASISFFATCILLSGQYLPIHPTLPQSPIVSRVLSPFVALVWAVAIIMSRVWLGYHTWAQVAVGAGYGCVYAVVWFVVWTRSGLSQMGQEIEKVVGW